MTAIYADTLAAHGSCMWGLNAKWLVIPSICNIYIYTIYIYIYIEIKPYISMYCLSYIYIYVNIYIYSGGGPVQLNLGVFNVIIIWKSFSF